MAMNLPFEGEKGPETRVSAVTDCDVATCGLDEKVSEVAERLGGGDYCVVVDDGVVLGVLEGDALADPTKTAAEAMSPGPSTFRPPVPKLELADYLLEHDLERTLVTTLDGRLVGLARLADLLPEELSEH